MEKGERGSDCNERWLGMKKGEMKGEIDGRGRRRRRRRRE